MKSKKIKIAIAFFTIVIIGIIFSIYFISENNKNDINKLGKLPDITTTDDTTKNIIEENNINVNGDENNKKKLDITPLIDSTNQVITDEDLRLKKVIDAYSYFLTKQCINTYYSSKEKCKNVLPKELKQYDILSFYGRIEEPSFCIDNIYKAEISLDQKIYVVYYRLESGNGSYRSLFNILKIDKKNVSFAIYPFEYLKSKNISNLKENDLIPTDIINLDDIERTEYNHYRIDDISTSEVACIREIFERCKFDYEFDRQHLYGFLNEKYKSAKFENFEIFNNYLNNTNLLKGNIEKYDSKKLNDYTQYIVLGSHDNYYVINYRNLFNYDLILDEYTIISEQYSEVYNSNFPNVQARYCIDRVRRAINDKNYKFIYNKLSSDDRSRNYSNYNDFANFIRQNFYDKNAFEYLDFKTMLGGRYKYSVKVTDETGSSFSYRKLNITVTLKDNADFEISITK